MTLDEAGDDEEEKADEAEKTSRSAKRKQDDDTGVCYLFKLQHTLCYNHKTTISLLLLHLLHFNVCFVILSIMSLTMQDQ